uniref:O-acetyl-ADP-ribose deacetylase (Regulator of RNase III), contains Macro domain n=1 Tax=Candidatus Kentrum sp. DK TaxID=2126562 RepID=A0A450SUV6_9GAMM|nr:MAG: O-acetyl-ADP-ribose deacetylase (regulator of RNase III), contains Macro domain [Candidatus Kentron sp. DK]
MMKVLIGDLFESKAKTIVNTVNCVGVMGKGIAQVFKKRYPGMFDDYAQRCRLKQIQPGIPYLYTDLSGASIINFPTKDHWRSPSRLDDVIKGLDVFAEKYKEWGIESVAFPPLGCGNGGLEWVVVGPVMYQRLLALDITVEIHAPYGTPKQHLTEEFLGQAVLKPHFVKGHKQKRLNDSWVALLEVIDRLQRQPHANPVGRTIFQKICYIFTEQGVNTGFHFKQGSYGPFSAEVKEALSVFANANLIQEQQLGRMTALRIGPEYASVRARFVDQLKPLEKKIDKTVDLFSRIKSTAQAEEVTTVLYAARKLKKDSRDNSVSEKDIYDYILEWKKDWQREEKQAAIASAIRNLEMLRWLRLQYSDSLPMEDL